MHRAACVLLVAGCGRYHFEARTTGDGAMGSDAPSDVATPDVSRDAANLCLPSYRICDGFEGPLTATWSMDPGVSIDPSVAHRGASSVHFQSPALAVGQQGYFRIFNSTVLPLADSPLYVRAFFRFGGLPAGTNAMELIAADQNGGPNFGDFLFLKAASLVVYEQFDDFSNPAPTAPPLGTWICTLWTVVRDTGKSGSITLDGDLGATSITGVTTDGTPPLSFFSFGIGYSGTNVSVAQPAMDVWMDDLIVSPTAVTCFD